MTVNPAPTNGPTPTPNQMPGAAEAAASAAPVPTETTPPPAQPAPAPAASPAAPPPAPAAPGAPIPPWEVNGTPFDPERAWNLIQEVRGDLNRYRQQAQPILDAHEQQRLAAQTDLERATENLATTAAERDGWRNRAVTAEAKVLTAGRFHDADVVLACIGDLSPYINGDTVDVPKLQQRLDELAAEKPFLAIPQAAPPPPGFAPNRGQGQSGAGQLSIDEQIKAAQARGDVMGSIALKQQKQYQQQS